MKYTEKTRQQWQDDPAKKRIPQAYKQYVYHICLWLHPLQARWSDTTIGRIPSSHQQKKQVTYIQAYSNSYSKDSFILTQPKSSYIFLQEPVEPNLCISWVVYSSPCHLGMNTHLQGWFLYRYTKQESLGS